jgi:hypothetical protein
MGKGKLIRVIFEYENAIREMTDRPQQWLEKVNNLCVLAEVRGANPFRNDPHEWTEKKKDDSDLKSK